MRLTKEASNQQTSTCKLSKSKNLSPNWLNPIKRHVVSFEPIHFLRLLGKSFHQYPSHESILIAINWYDNLPHDISARKLEFLLPANLLYRLYNRKNDVFG